MGSYRHISFNEAMDQLVGLLKQYDVVYEQYQQAIKRGQDTKLLEQTMKNIKKEIRLLTGEDSIEYAKDLVFTHLNIDLRH